MDASSNHKEDQEWDLLEDLGHDLCGSVQTDSRSSLETQKDGTHPAGRHNSMVIARTLPEKVDFQRPHHFVEPHCCTILASFNMAPKLTNEEIEEAQEQDRNAERVKIVAWAFGAVPINDAHRQTLSRPSDPKPSEFAEVERVKLRADYLGWMFGGVPINKAHDTWGKMSPTEKEALKAKMSRSNQQRTDEQVW